MTTTVQLSLFDMVEKPKIIKVVDTHPEKTIPTQYSVCWCWDCDKTVAMAWVIHGELKRCPDCRKEYEGWKQTKN